MTEAAAANAANAAPAAAIAPAPDSLAARTRAEAMRIFLAQWRGTTLALLVVTTAVMIAWRNQAPLSSRMGWLAFAALGYAVQSVAAWQLDRASSLAAALPRWMPLLLAGVLLSSVNWGLVPWVVAGSGESPLLFACLFNAMVLFCVCNAPGTPAMMSCAAVPMLVLTSLALARQPGLFYAGIGCAALFMVIWLYGLRVVGATLAALREGLLARDLAEDLRRRQQQVVALERERTLLLERQRLMRDMHDVLGSALTASLALVERGQLHAPTVADMLRECLDDLRSVIDSLDPIDNDLVALLATLRFRVERRLQAAGIGIGWQMDDLPPLSWLGPSEALHVMRIVLEALNNVARHAGASRVAVSATHADGHVQVRIADDGHGFDTAAAHTGRGLRFLRQRAAALGGVLRIDSAPGRGTTVSLRLPVHK